MNTEQLELPEMPIPKKRGRPASGNAKTTAERVAEYRRKMRESEKWICDPTACSTEELLIGLKKAIKYAEADNEWRDNVEKLTAEINKRFGNG